jgi:tetratricopeptide (TPR) repeat protein
LAGATTALRQYWWNRGLLSEGVAWLERAAALPGTTPKIRANVLLALAFLCEVRSDYSRAVDLINEALPISRRYGDQAGVAKAMTGLGEIAENRGDFDRARDMHQEALEICRSAGLHRGSAVSLNNLATIAYYQGDFPRATSQWTQAVAMFRALGEQGAVGMLLGNQGLTAMAAGDFDRAVGLYQEHQSIAHELNDPGAIGRALCNLAEARQLRGDGHLDDMLERAIVLHRQTDDRQGEVQTLTLMADSALHGGDPRRAAGLYAESLSICRATGDRTLIATIALFERIATVALAASQHTSAARLLGCGDALRKELGAPILPYLRPLRDRCLDQLRFSLKNAAMSAAAIDEGTVMPTETAIRAALALCEGIHCGQVDASVDVIDAASDAVTHVSV